MLNKKNNNSRNPLVMNLINNKHTVKLLNTLLVLLIIWVTLQILPIFRPINKLINLFAFPLIGAGILAFIFGPIVKYLSERGVNKHISILGIFIIIFGLLVWGGYSLIPILREQTIAFINDMPIYQEQILYYFHELPFNLDELIFNETLENLFGNIDWNSLTENFQLLVTTTFGGLGNVIGSLTQFFLGLITLPVVLYYLLLDGEKIPNIILYHTPDKHRENIESILYKINHQISGFIRGTIIVAVVVGIIFWTGYKIIGLEYAFLLSFLAAIFNIIPYLGSVFSVIPALLIALVTSPYMLFKVILVLAIEQFIESRIIQPYILGSSLNIHPVTILLVILSGGRLFGIKGVLLAVPVYAIVKVIVTELYNSFRQKSDLYQDDVDKFLDNTEDIANEKTS